MRHFHRAIAAATIDRPHTKYGMVVTEGGKKTPLFVIRGMGDAEVGIQSTIQTKMGRVVETFHEEHEVYNIASRDCQIHKGHTSLEPK